MTTMTERKIQMLEALAGNGAVALGLLDLIDQDFKELEADKFVHRYWGTGGAMCSMAPAGRDFMAARAKAAEAVEEAK